MNRTEANHQRAKSYGTASKIVLILSLLAPMMFLHTLGCSENRTLRVMAADSLTHSFSKICKDFERDNPGCSVILETQGSIMLTRMAMIRPCDVLAVADHRLIEQMMRKEADWVIPFATSEMVLCWTSQSPYSDRITTRTWPEILLRDDVTLGLANPGQDPCGYFTIMCWKLAEKTFPQWPELSKNLVDKVPRKRLAFDSGKLLSRLQAFSTDYVFAYKSQCEDMHLPYLILPETINLGNKSFLKEYETIEVEVPDYRGQTMTVKGSLIKMGVTIPHSCRNTTLAEKFISYLLSDKGTNHLLNSSFRVITVREPSVWGPPPPQELQNSRAENGVPSSETSKAETPKTQEQR